MSQGTYTSVTIGNGLTTSTGYRTQGATRGSFLIPSDFTGTACKVQVAISATGEPSAASSAWTDCPVEGNEVVAKTVAPGKAVALDIKTFNFDWIRFVVDAQTGQKTIVIFTRD